MLNLDELMRKATPEQRVILSKLKGLVGEEKKLIEEAKKSCDRENDHNYRFPSLDMDRPGPTTDEQAQKHLRSYSSSTKRRLDEIQGKIKKTVEDASKLNVLVVPYNSLR